MRAAALCVSILLSVAQLGLPTPAVPPASDLPLHQTAAGPPSDRDADVIPAGHIRGQVQERWALPWVAPNTCRANVDPAARSILNPQLHRCGFSHSTSLQVI